MSCLRHWQARQPTEGGPVRHTLTRMSSGGAQAHAAARAGGAWVAVVPPLPRCGAAPQLLLPALGAWLRTHSTPCVVLCYVGTRACATGARTGQPQETASRLGLGAKRREARFIGVLFPLQLRTTFLFSHDALLRALCVHQHGGTEATPQTPPSVRACYMARRTKRGVLRTTLAGPDKNNRPQAKP